MQTHYFLCLVTFFSSLVIFSQDTTKVVKEVPKKQNISTETVTKTIRVKWPNGEEKIITKEEVIVKKSGISFDPNDENKTNQEAQYDSTKVEIKVSDFETKIPAKTYTSETIEDTVHITFWEGDISEKAILSKINDKFYIVKYEKGSTSLGYFKEGNKFVLETKKENAEEMERTTYHLKKQKSL